MVIINQLSFLIDLGSNSEDLRQYGAVYGRLLEGISKNPVINGKKIKILVNPDLKEFYRIAVHNPSVINENLTDG
jgi:hypothetical protein